MTTGRVYQTVIQKERNLEYGGKCVEVVPHIPMEIRDRIQKAVRKTKAEIMIIEVGGTVGEYQNLLFLEAARMMKLYNPEDVLFVMVSYLPIPAKIGEMKTKPTMVTLLSLLRIYSLIYQQKKILLFGFCLNPAQQLKTYFHARWSPNI